MNHMPPHRTEHRFEETSMLAYHLWQQANCPPGEDLKFWLQAEEQLFGKSGQQPTANAKQAGTTKAVAKRATAPTGNGPSKNQPGNTKKTARAR